MEMRDFLRAIKEGPKPCIRSGYCCSKAPCSYGEGIPCIHLGGSKAGEHFCMKYDEIVKDESSWMSPAFGAGCCSSLNSVRQDLLKEQKEKGNDKDES